MPDMIKDLFVESVKGNMCPPELVKENVLAFRLPFIVQVIEEFCDSGTKQPAGLNRALNKAFSHSVEGALDTKDSMSRNLG